MVVSQVDYRAQTMRSYDRLGSELSQAFDDFFERHARHEAAHFLSGIDPGSRILDLGCGGGPASTYFIDQGHETISADLSAAMLSECQRRGLTRLVRLDLEALPFGPWSVDGLWAHTSLLHVPKVRLTAVLEALRETLNYPDHPLVGLLLFPVGTVLLSIIFGWLKVRSGSVWAASLAHAATNTIGGSLTMLLFIGGPNWIWVSYLGVLGWIPLGILCAWIIWTGQLEPGSGTHRQPGQRQGEGRTRP